MTCLCNCPPMINILEESKPNTGFTNFINTGMLRSLVQLRDGVCNIRAGLKDSEGVVLNVTAGLRESKGHIYTFISIRRKHSTNRHLNIKLS